MKTPRVLLSDVGGYDMLGEGVLALRFCSLLHGMGGKMGIVYNWRENP